MFKNLLNAKLYFVITMLVKYMYVFFLVLDSQIKNCEFFYILFYWLKKMKLSIMYILCKIMVLSINF